MFPFHFLQTLLNFLSVCTVTGAASVSVAARTCHLTLLATSWNIQQESFAQVPPNNTAPGAAPAARIPGRVASFIWYAFLFGSYTNGGAWRDFSSMAGEVIQIGVTAGCSERGVEPDRPSVT